MRRSGVFFLGGEEVHIYLEVDQFKEKLSTPRKINIEPENDSLEDVFPFPGVYCQVPC